MLGERTLSRSASGYIHMNAEDFAIAEKQAEGVSGVYLVKDKTNRKWIFKPADEEPYKTSEDEMALENKTTATASSSSMTFPEEESVLVVPTNSKKVNH